MEDCCKRGGEIKNFWKMNENYARFNNNIKPFNVI